ncbi:hypothetical protein J6590_040513 [Homalodisca vitripennis]|nr:hypothetical protein J6590_094723 [Homalodisca vitripennis]KAG8277508.1 hypothetical protein J6590_040513 [Homalodisca vitripennis]
MTAGRRYLYPLLSRLFAIPIPLEQNTLLVRVNILHMDSISGLCTHDGRTSIPLSAPVVSVRDSNSPGTKHVTGGSQQYELKSNDLVAAFMKSE